MTLELRVVLDTNVLISALVFKQGILATLRQTWQGKGFTPLVSRATVTELIRVLAYPKFRLSKTEQEELLADYLPYCNVIPMQLELPAVPDCRDLFDVPFLQLALVGQADYLVTGDRDLLSLTALFEIPIVNAEQFLAILSP
ncbi:MULTISPECIES: putative toxin-antitoxin system toxin component, PIN family [Cyanophyceae]|uniref:Toxin-antitoxin system toxin component, PIN family n=1 Tax=Leptolyngbya subtilissima DQ-A4 TaxID=2933933 RepID=A0ABV0K2V4_9CYAN|nr:putative toxin-antitoxin system toxin component, PIN family [Nodosilinea sp. FACHB-141]MBD2113071.1 putative toxin-antitoxin system toxin component, PIN family [Nodosilinea sp. FACHB-141]